jgi:hypothetical protein
MEMTLFYSTPGTEKDFSNNFFKLYGFGECIERTMSDTEHDIDYMVWEPGKYHVANGTPFLVLLFYRSGNWQICLVLRRVDGVKEEYERIGLMSRKYGLPSEYTDEMGATRSCWEERTITIV